MIHFLREGEDDAKRAVQAMRRPALLVDRSGGILAASRSALSAFAIKPGDETAAIGEIIPGIEKAITAITANDPVIFRRDDAPAPDINLCNTHRSSGMDALLLLPVGDHILILADAPAQEDAAASCGMMAAEVLPGVAHEMRNHLTGVKGFAGLLRRRITDDNARRDLARVEEQTDKAVELCSAMRSLAPANPPEALTFDLRVIIEKAIRLRSYILRRKRFELRLENGEESAAVHGHEHLLLHAFLRALDACEKTVPPEVVGEITISLRRSESGACAVFKAGVKDGRACDTGAGFTESLESLRLILTESGGSVALRCAGQTMEFSVELPAAETGSKSESD
ncbi:MAG TPA: histidine kinase dimerization/phospho-acceptor domain-containing protein [Candidatus Brocadiia bacterium]|nr:histidine kinase dimerization/phospho-acceptor domain-containing protein [Candidatus Brocadiia bacterium]